MPARRGTLSIARQLATRSASVLPYVLAIIVLLGGGASLWWFFGQKSQEGSARDISYAPESRAPLTGAQEIQLESLGQGANHAQAFQTALMYPSGKWAGYYVQLAEDGSGPERNPVEFDIEFGPDGSISGSGTDDVGEYWLKGQGTQTGSIWITKSYSSHEVQYEGNMVGSNLAAGIEGTWRIHDDSDGGIHAEDRINNDTFYIWPPEP